MEENNFFYSVFIPTAGIGLRLGELTKYTNKTLVRVGRKPALSYIIESHPADVPLVIALGYYGKQVRDFVKLAYPERQVIFVDVDNYDGPGSSLGHTMLKAKQYLQTPFIYHAADTIVPHPIPRPDHNWVGGHRGDDAAQYASWKLQNGKVYAFNDRGAIDFDTIHIGLVGIYDHGAFWQALERRHAEDPQNSLLNDCVAVTDMLASGHAFRAVDFPTWHDIGNTASLHHARNTVGDAFGNLDKVDESIFLFDDFVIKFFADKRNVRERVERAGHLDGLVPRIEGHEENFYRYRKAEGELYSRVVTPSDFEKFLSWARTNLWKPSDEVSPEEFQTVCKGFYVGKTESRVQKFLESNALKDQPHVINGEVIPSIAEMVKTINVQWLTDGLQTLFHGDCILDNIIRTREGWVLLDWRQNFGGLMRSGDVYYDLAKLNHNLTVNHDIIHQNLFSVSIEGDVVTCDIMRKENLVACQRALFAFLAREGFDAHKVQVLTAIIWLNMSPLHHHPFNLFLYYFGKLNLWRALRKNN